MHTACLKFPSDFHQKLALPLVAIALSALLRECHQGLWRTSSSHMPAASTSGGAAASSHNVYALGQLRAYLCLFLSSAALRSVALTTSTLPSTAPVLMTMTSPLSAAKSLSASSAYMSGFKALRLACG